MLNDSLSRRELLQATVAAGAAASFSSLIPLTVAAADQKVAMKGNINHSVVFWCFNVAGEKWDIDNASAKSP